MSFDPKAFLESCVGKDADSLFTAIADAGNDTFNVRFGPRFSKGRTDDGYEIVVEWHDHTEVLSFSIFLDYREFGVTEAEEAIMLVDRMNGHTEQLVRFSNYCGRADLSRTILATAGLVVFDHEQEAWRTLYKRAARTLTHLVGETEWHIRHSGKASTRTIQTN